MKSWKLRTSLSMVLIGLAVLTQLACRREALAHGAHEPAKFIVTSPLRKDAELTREYVAQIRAIQHIELRAQARGYLQRTYVDEGQHVEQGQKMFQIMPLLYEAELRKAEAEADFARLEYQNTKLLADGNVVSPNELALSKAKMSRAAAERDLAAAHRALTLIRAPFAGIMGRFQVRLGSLVDEGELLTTLSDNSTVWVYFNVSESEYLAYQAGAREKDARTVSLVMANGELFDQPGRIETIEADFDNETGNIAFRAAFPNPLGLLRHGETGKVQLRRPLQDALIIPQQATFDVMDKKYVYVVDAHNVVHAREVHVAHELPHVYLLERGLDERDRILLAGLRKVRDGSEIAVEYQRPTDVLARLEPPAQ